MSTWTNGRKCRSRNKQQQRGTAWLTSNFISPLMRAPVNKCLPRCIVGTTYWWIALSDPLIFSLPATLKTGGFVNINATCSSLLARCNWFCCPLSSLQGAGFERTSIRHPDGNRTPFNVRHHLALLHQAPLGLRQVRLVRQSIPELQLLVSRHRNGLRFSRGAERT